MALTKPDSDAVVTTSTVDIEGAVDQASQIEVRVDDAYNSSIPLNVGQTTFTGSVEISAGTHTIKVTAIHTCSSNNAEDSVVVTYEVPPQTPSNGSDTPTTAGGVTYGGDGVSKTDNSHSEGTGVIDAALTPVKDLASWLNVKIDEGSTNMASLSLARATTFTVGLSLAIIGVAPVVAGAVASSPMVVGLLPAAMPSRRLFIVGSAGRIIGVFLAVGSLFL